MSSRWPAGIIRKNPITPAGPAGDGAASGVWTLSEAMYWQKQGLWPIPGYVPPDPYFPYVTMLLSTTSLGNANNNLFVDSSGAFNPISRNGNTTQGSVTPYSVNWSNYFDGSSTLTFSQINMAGDFTIEGWVYFIGTNNPTVLGANPPNHQSLRRLSGKHYFYREGVDITGTIDVPLNQWVHLAATRSSGTVRIFTNGVLDGSRTITGTFSLFCLGGVDTVNDRLTGYTSNMRVVNGTALYTATFTPPTAPLTAVSGTALLTSQSNRFRDASTNNLTFTVNGSPRVTDFAPFSPASPGITYNQSDITNWSGYFDGDGDYFDTQNSSAFNYGTGDFTIECWGYRGSPSNFWCGYSAKDGASFTLFSYAGASSTIQVYSSGFYDSGINPGYNTWFHVAVVRQSGTMKIYINGVLGFSGAYTTNIASHVVRVGSSTASEWGLGYVSNLRVVKGTAVYTSAFTPPTTPLTAISGTQLLTCQNAAFTDNSSNNFTFTFGGTPTVTGNSPFNTVGYWSNYFDGSGDWLSLDDSSAWDFGTGDFTIELWVCPLTSGTATGHAYVSTYANSGSGWMLGVDSNGLRFSWGDTYIISNANIPTVGQWNHVAVSRSGTSARMFLNGTQIGSTVTNSTDLTNTQGLRIGRLSDGAYAIWYFTGYMSNIRVVKGTAVYTSNFTVPTTPLTAITNTQLLTCQNGRFIDNSTNNFTITRNGDIKIQSFNPFYTSTIASNGGSIYFDGSGDWLSTPSSYTLPSTTDFTLEFWLYPSAAFSSNRGLVACGGARFGLITEAGSIYFLSNSTEFDTNTNPIPGAWNHIAMTRTSGTIRIFLNGVQIGTRSSNTDSFTSQQFYIGSDQANEIIPQSYMTDVRWAYTSFYSSNFTPPTAPLTPTANTALLVNSMNAGIYDATAINDMETVSGAQVVTTVSKFGGSSAFFNGTGGFLDIPAASSKDSAFGTGNFTVEMWLYFNSVSGSPTIITFNNFGSGDGFFLNVESSAIGVRADGSTPIRASTTVTTGVWYHVAVTRNNGTLRLFQDGVNVGSATWTTNCTAGLLRIGQPKDTTGATYAYSGYMDDLRVTKGIARYTANFTPPTKAFTPF